MNFSCVTVCIIMCIATNIQQQDQTSSYTHRPRGRRGGLGQPLHHFTDVPQGCISTITSIKRPQGKENNKTLNQNNLIDLSSKYSFPTILNTNCQSLVPKLDQLSTVLKQHGVDVAGVTEHWLKSHVPDSIVAIDRYNLERRDRETINCGGVCLNIREEIPYVRWNELEDPKLESLWVTMRPKYLPRQWSHISVGVIYLPPGCKERPRKETPMRNHILHALDTITKKHPSSAFVVLGDFNKMKDLETTL